MQLRLISRVFGHRLSGGRLPVGLFLSRLIWLCMLPLVVLAAVLGLAEINDNMAASEAAAQQRVQTMVATLDLELNGRIRLLQVLAQSRDLDAPSQLAAFRDQALVFRDAAAGEIILADREGQMQVHTRLPMGSPLPKLPPSKGRTAHSQVLARGQPAVSDLVFGPVARQPLVTLGVPVQRGGATVAVLLLVLDARSFEHLLPTHDWPAGWLLRVQDGLRQTIAQLGQVPAGPVDEAQQFSATSTLSGWQVQLLIPKAEFQAPLRDAVWKLGLLLVAVTGSGVVGGSLAGRRLTRSLTALSRRRDDQDDDAGDEAIEEVATARRLMDASHQVGVTALAALDDSQRTFQALINGMDDAIVYTDTARHIRLVNPAFTRQYGYTAEEVAGRTTDFLYAEHAEYERLGREHFDTQLTSQTPRLEMRLRRKDGSPVWVEVAAMRIAGTDGATVGLLGVHRDISKRKVRQGELEAHRERLEDMVRERTAALAAANTELAERARAITALYDGAPCGYLSLQADGTITAANRTALAMLDQTAESFVGHRFAEFLTRDSRRLHAGWAESFQRTGQARGLSYDMLRRDGRVVPVLLDADFDRDDAGTMVGARATLVDDSLRRARDQQIAEMQSELARRTELAEAANRAKGAFLANMSHEIRTPLNAIIGLTHLLVRDTTDARQRDRLGKVAASGQHLLEVINDVLDLSKIEAGKVVLNSVDFALDDLLAGVLAMVADAARDKGVRLVLQAPDVPNAWQGDDTRLAQALLNLLANAVKFTEQGQIQVQVQVVAREALRCKLRFEVQDTGPGIAPDRQPALFSAFEQADNSMTRRHGGTGLGLALTRHLAELMGGEVGLHSAVGAGSTFWFTAWLQPASGPAKPAAPADVGAAAHPASSEAKLRAHHKGRRVLLAEDNPINQEVGRSLMEDVGLVVDVVDDGAQAVAAVQARDYDLVMMDMQMPVMDGLTATQALRAAGATQAHAPGETGSAGARRLPIIAMTANAFQEDRLSCLAAGMDDHVAKPVDADQLYDTLLRWLPASA